MSVFENSIQKGQIVGNALPGFENIRRYWDSRFGRVSAKLQPGQYYVTMQDEAIATVLGSCISACIRDRVFGIGGMNHFMLPSTTNSMRDGGYDPIPDEAARYGAFAMELLINSILKSGGRRENLEIKVVGGGRILANLSDIGRHNIRFVRKFLETEKLPIISEDLGDIYPRKVIYFPATGKVRVKKLRRRHAGLIVGREGEYMEQLKKRPTHGSVELF
ncbi:MAG: chemoreceptor glutamine deamidase CheD [Gammaproteobacteria bacterium]